MDCWRFHLFHLFHNSTTLGEAPLHYSACAVSPSIVNWDGRVTGHFLNADLDYRRDAGSEGAPVPPLVA